MATKRRSTRKVRGRTQKKRSMKRNTKSNRGRKNRNLKRGGTNKKHSLKRNMVKKNRKQRGGWEWEKVDSGVDCEEGSEAHGVAIDGADRSAAALKVAIDEAERGAAELKAFEECLDGAASGAGVGAREGSVPYDK